MKMSPAELVLGLFATLVFGAVLTILSHFFPLGDSHTTIVAILFGMFMFFVAFSGLLWRNQSEG